MKTLIVLMFLFAVMPCVSAQQTSLITNTDGRKTVNLDGQWKVIVDPYETGYYDYRYEASANVYLNGEKIGRHEGGFTAFNFEVTKLIRDKGNFLIVKVDNKRRRDAVPTMNTDWWNYGG